MKNNFPTYRFKMANPKKPFIGLYLFTPPKKKQGMFWELVDIITDAEDHEIYKDHQNKIVLINTGPITTTDFNLTKEKKEFLLASGKFSAVEFIKKYYPDFDSSMYDLASLQKDVDDKLKKV